MRKENEKDKTFKNYGMKLGLVFPRILQAGQVEEDTGQNRVSDTKS